MFANVVCMAGSCIAPLIYVILSPVWVNFGVCTRAQFIRSGRCFLWPSRMQHVNLEQDWRCYQRSTHRISILSALHMSTGIFAGICAQRRWYISFRRLATDLKIVQKYVIVMWFSTFTDWKRNSKKKNRIRILPYKSINRLNDKEIIFIRLWLCEMASDIKFWDSCLASWLMESIKISQKFSVTHLT